MKEINMNLFKKLPIEIIRENILPYTYNIQNPRLCLDIKSFYLTYNYLSRIFYIKYAFDHLDRLAKYIARFINADVPTIYGYTDNCIPIYRRLYVLKDKDYKFIRNYVWFISNHLLKRNTIRNYLSILNPFERYSLIINSF
tara:strand:+ start:356 stop:778 length:423 start_codon:yes stop_codon:yes gene_type:complete